MAGGRASPSPRAMAPFSHFDLPLYHFSVGDGILVYWDGDRKWYPGKIIATAGDHECEVLYEDGDREWVALDKVRYIARRHSDSSNRRRGTNEKARSGKGDGGDEREETDGKNEKDLIKDIKSALLDIEDRIPLEGVYEENARWWNKWHDGILLSVKNKDIHGLMDAALSLSLQLKPNICSTWWVKHHTDWKKQLRNVTTTRDAASIVTNLRDNAVNWSIARKLFAEDEAISRDDCFQDEPKYLDGVDSREHIESSNHFGLSRDHRKQGSFPQKCSNLSSSSIVPCLSSELPLSDSIMSSTSKPGNSECILGTEDVSFLNTNICIQDHQCHVDAGYELRKRQKIHKINQTENCTLGSFGTRKSGLSLKQNPNSGIQNDKCCADARYELRNRKKTDSISQTKNHAAFSSTALRKGQADAFACRRSSRLEKKPICKNDFSSQCPEDLLKAPVQSKLCSSNDQSKKDSVSSYSSPSKFGSLDTRESIPTITCDRENCFLSPCHESLDQPCAEETTHCSISRKASTSDKIIDQDGNHFNKESSHDSKKVSINHLMDELLCDICQTSVASNLFVHCKGDGCNFAAHSFCLYPPLQTLETDWLCPYCKGDYLFNSKLTLGKKAFLKKLQSIVGRRRVVLDLQGNAYQDQFLVKWDSLSHYHDAWVPSEWLYILDRARLQSFQKKYHLFGDTSLIDLRKPEWFQIDRVIASRRKFNSNSSSNIWSMSHAKKDSKELEFLVKWKGLDYCDATWESSCTEELLAEVGKLIHRLQRAVGRIDDFTLATSNWAHGTTPDDLFGDTLFGYQLQGVNWILSNYKSRKNVILADEMGLGKTVQVICFIQCIMQFNVYPVLIVAPKSILFQWEKEFCHWAKDLNVIVYQGEKQSRRVIQVHEMYSSEKMILFDALVTSYELILLDSSVLKKFKWSAIVIDEAHKIKKLDCKLANCLKQYSSDFRLLLTGTPLQNNLLELFALLHFIDPEKFSNPKSEAESFSTIGSGLEHLHAEAKVTQIQELLKPRMLRRMKADVLPKLIPAKKWVEVPCALTDYQRELYINILEKNYIKLNKEIHSGRKITLNFILTDLRKCCNHPYLFPGQETDESSQKAPISSLVAKSGKLQLLQKLLPKLKERGNRVLLFSQMTKMLDILEDFLLFLGLAYFRIDGQTSLALREQYMKDFNNKKSDIFVFLISTRAGGLGIDLPTADRVIIYDPDFNPFMDLQAQSRAHRIGQTRPVVVYQLITKCTVEEKILQKSKQKLAIENLVMNPSKKPSVSELHSILLHGVRTILNRNRVHMPSINYDDDAIETLLKLEPAAGESCCQEENGYLGSIQSFIPDAAESKEPHSPKHEWKEILGEAISEKHNVDLGRGKRKKTTANYECDDGSDSDEVYSPEDSSESGGSTDGLVDLEAEAAYTEI